MTTRWGSRPIRSQARNSVRRCSEKVVGRARADGDVTLEKGNTALTRQNGEPVGFDAIRRGVIRDRGWHRLVLALTNSTPNALGKRPDYDEQLAWFDRFGQMHVEPCT